MEENWVYTPRVGKYLNLPISLDLETTSTVNSMGEKIAFMYCWQINENGTFIMGRTWMEFAQWYVDFIQRYNITPKRKAIIWVHNLGFDFQFFRKLFEWEQVFALRERKIVYGRTKQGVEFRCSYILTNKPLANLADEVGLKKMAGDLDYSLIRHYNTPLTQKEIGYCREDVHILTEYIRKQINIEGGITKIPLTATGYVRREVKKRCFANKNYRNSIKRLQLQVEEYKMLKEAFAGGFTHANASHSGKILHDVKSYDFTSAYPAVMLSEQFPMSSGIKVENVTLEDLRKYLKLYCCVFNITFRNIERKQHIAEDYLSASKCSGQMIVENNGRVNSAKTLTTTITDIDFKIITKVYDFEDFEIGTLYYYRKDYLPVEILRSTVEFYKLKTELKGVEDKELEYLVSKGMLNSIYGMMVTDINRDSIVYAEDVWSTEPVSVEEGIDKYNKGTGRFLHYPWGVWVTAYNRYNLWSAIIEAGEDYIYSDTDSIKLMNYDRHLEYFDNYNDKLIAKLKLMCETTGIEFNDLNPKDIKEKHHLIGVWDDEGIYDIFKTLGAKRYMWFKKDVWNKDKKIYEDILSITISGVNKKTAVPWLLKTYGTVNSVFNAFEENLVFPAEASGKKTHIYIDDEIIELVTDYLGETVEVNESAGVHIEPAEYSLSISEKYKEFILKTQKIR